jgi:hypothetical protein
LSKNSTKTSGTSREKSSPDALSLPFQKQMSIAWLKSGLPDFSWYNIPKRENIPKLPQNLQNGYKLYCAKWQKNRPNGCKMYQHLSWQDTLKVYPN